MLQKIATLIALFSLCSAALAQTSVPPKPTEAELKLTKDAVELLRDTSEQVGRLRLVENRVSFNAELAGLMWFYDEKEARTMYGSVIADFKQLLIQLNDQANAPIDEEEDGGMMGGFFGGYGRSKVERKFMIAAGVREQIAMSLAEHEPDLAYNFYEESRLVVGNPKLRELMAGSDKMFEHKLLEQIALSNPAKAVEHGKASLKNGLDSSHVSLLKKLYSKDPDKGIELAAAILSKLKSGKTKNSWVISELLTYGDKNLEESKKKSSKKPVYSFSELREIADVYGQTLLDRNNDSEDGEYYGMGNEELIGKYSSTKAAQIKAKEAQLNSASNVKEMRLDRLTNTNAVRGMSTGTSGVSANSNRAVSDLEVAAKARAEKEKSDKDLLEKLAKFGDGVTNKDAREKLVTSTRAAIAKMGGKDKKVAAYGLLATQVAKAGDKELAGEIMNSAERLVDPMPKNYQDFLLSWMLASAYAQTEPEKAFPILESTILRANSTIGAAIKMAEFVDVNDDYITDGEAQVGVFGGAMIRGITGEIAGANSTLSALAKADFAKTAALTNAFDRPEIQVLAKMLVLRSVLDKARSAKAADGEEPELVVDELS
jgi:hypothetical protein